MSFDEAKFREAAKAAGYSDKEIDAELKGPTPAGAVAPSPIVSGAETANKFQTEADAKRAAIVQGFEENSKKDATTNPMTMEGVLTSTPALVTGAALLGALTTYAAPKVYKSVKERFMTKAPEAPVRIEPIGFESFADMTPATQAPNPLGQTNLTPEDLQARAAQTRAAITPEMPVNTPITAAPVDAPAPTPSAQPNSPVTSIVNDTVKEMIQEAPAQPMEAAKPPVAAPAAVAPPQELRTGTGKPAFAGMGPEAKISKRTGKPQFKSEYASLADVPKGYAVVPNAQYVDVLRGIGQPEFTAAFTGRNFPTDYEQAVEATKEINRQLGRPTRAEAKAAGQPYGENVPGITQRTTENKKLVNVKGVGLGALVAIPDLVKAQTAGERGMAGANLLEAVLPPGFMMSGAGAGSDMPPRMSQAMLLGSPYAQSPLAVKQRQALEYERKVGAGRGIAPPSAYQR